MAGPRRAAAITGRRVAGNAWEAPPEGRALIAESGGRTGEAPLLSQSTRENRRTEEHDPGPALDLASLPCLGVVRLHLFLCRHVHAP